MFSKKHILILLLLIVAFGTISSVSADDINATDEITPAPDTTEIAIEENNNTAIADDSNINATVDSENNDSSDNEEYNSKITVEQSGKYLNDKVYKVTLTDLNGTPLKNNYVEFFIYSNTNDNYEYKIVKTNDNGIATYKWNSDSLPAGTYTVEINPYDTDFKEVVFENVKVSKQSIIIKTKKLTTTYSSGKTFDITVVDSQNKPVSGVKLTLKVYTGKKYKTVTVTTNSKGIAKYKASTLSKGTHKIVITPKNAKATKKESKVVISARALTINAKSYKVNTYDFAGGLINIQVKDKSTKKALNGITLTLKIYTGKKYKTVKLVTGYDSDDKKNGIAGIFTNQYSAGTHKVKITPTSKNYKGSATAKLIITKSAKKNYYNFHIYFSKGKETFKVYY